MNLFDTHAHYNDEKFDEDRENILNKVYKSGVINLVCAGYSLESSKKAIEIANSHEFIYATVGISPNDIPDIKCEMNSENFENELDKQLIQIEELAKQTKVVAIGEIGLDYYWNKENSETQKIAFLKQIKLANKLNLPIVIHTRDAVLDTIDILKKYTPNKKGVFHCCPQNIELVKQAVKLGFYISFAGPVTFKNSKSADEIINLVPLDKILIETDSPYLAPEPVRGTRNDSSNVKYIAEKVSKIRRISVEEVAKITYENAKKIFQI